MTVLTQPAAPPKRMAWWVPFLFWLGVPVLEVLIILVLYLIQSALGTNGEIDCHWYYISITASFIGGVVSLAAVAWVQWKAWPRWAVILGSVAVALCMLLNIFIFWSFWTIGAPIEPCF